MVKIEDVLSEAEISIMKAVANSVEKGFTLDIAGNVNRDLLDAIRAHKGNFVTGEKHLFMLQAEESYNKAKERAKRLSPSESLW